MYRIFYGRHLILAADQEDEEEVIPYELDTEFFPDLFKYLDSLNGSITVQLSESLSINILKKFFKIVKAAGGVVFNDNSEILMIFRLGKWDLPKGKLEKGEKFKYAAIREVEEECGISGLEITNKLDISYHIHFRKTWILKKTAWFKMYSIDKSDLVPQLEEGITKVEWVATDSLKPLTLDTYRSIREVLLQPGLLPE